MGNGGDEYRLRDSVAKQEKMDPCEIFGILGRLYLKMRISPSAAEALLTGCSLRSSGFLLEHYHIMDNPEFKLGLLIAYYPSRILTPKVGSWHPGDRASGGRGSRH